MNSETNEIMDEMEVHANKSTTDDRWWELGRKLEKAYQKKIAVKHPEWTRKQVNEKANEMTARQGNRIRGSSKHRFTSVKMKQETRREIDPD